MNKVARIWVLLILFSVGHVSAQPAFNFADIKKANPQEDVCVLKQKESVTIFQKKDIFKIVSDNESDILYLTEKATHMSEKSIFYYDKMSSISDIVAKTWIPNGSKMKSLNVDEDRIYTRKPVKEGIFFDDFMEKYFNYPALQEGAVSSLRYKEESFDPHFLGSFYFGRYVPVASSEYKVTFPENVRVKYLLKDKDHAVNFKEEKSKGLVTYTFTATNVKTYASEDDAPDLSYVTPHVIIYIDSYDLNGKSMPVLNGLPELYKWYTGLLGKMKNEKSPELKALSDSLTFGLTTKEDKVRKIFYWVQDNIRYIAFEEGLGGFVPREPVDIYHKRFGDCKDKTVILVSLLNEAGITAYPAWIGTRDIPYNYTDLANPAVSNHMIVVMPDNQGWQFLDGTSVHLPFGMPTSMIQGKEAMVNLSADSFVVVKVPEMDRHRNLMSEYYKFTLTDRKVEGIGSQSWWGYPNQSLFYNLNQLSESKRTEVMQKGLDIGNNKYSASEVEFKQYGNRDSALTVQFKFDISDYVSEADNQTYLNMHLKKPFLGDKMDLKKRENDRVFDYKSTDSIVVIFDIPSDYSVVELPSNRNYSNPDFGFSVKYKREGDKVILHREVWIDTLLLTKDKFPKWNEMIDQLTLAYKDLLIIKKK